MKAFNTLALAFALVMAVPLVVNAASDPAPPAATDSANAISEGEVRKVDKDAKKITIKHGELKNLNMPAMTMVFHVVDAAVLDQVKPGDKIHFVAEKVGTKYTVTNLEVKNQ